MVLTGAIRYVAPVILLVAGVALAQGSGPSSTPNVPGDTVPSWVFYWVLGLATFIGIVWSAVTKILWDRGNSAQDKALEAEKRASGLSESERHHLKQLFDWHNRVDDDQVPLWYVPRSWLELVRRLHDDHAHVRKQLMEIARQNEEVIADLRAQLKESRGQQAQQQTKMLKLAVRVQRAVEALAGLKPPVIEDDLNDNDNDNDEESA